MKAGTGLGFTAMDQVAHTADTNRKTLMDAVEKAFRPEFINRLDDIVVFQSLTKDDIRKIIDIEIAGVISRMKENMNIDFSLSEEAKSFLLQEGWSEVFGARPLKRAIEKYIENPLAEDVLRGKFKSSKRVVAVPTGTGLEFQTESE
jgi:ATP-dependent Clp protease ATP-binding subunit ClpC